MSMNFVYHYAELDPDTGECLGVFGSSTALTFGENDPVISIPVEDPEYVGKYYIDGNWYEDAEGTIPWQSSLL